MISEVFYWLLNASIIGSAAGLIVLIMRKFKAIPRFAIYVLWILPFIRLWLPFGIANEYSLLNLISRYTTKTVAIKYSPEVTMSNCIMGANSYFPIEYKNDLLSSIFNIASIVWLIVATAAIISSFLLYAYTKSELKSAEHIRDNIYKSDKLSAPAVYGIINPKIILPAALVHGDTDYIIMHEKVHIKRKDNLLRVLAVITTCIHWFNPLSWVFLKHFLQDMELACDAKVLKTLNPNQTKEYARAILACANGKVYFASSFGGAKTKIRIENILSYKKLTVFSTLCFTALVASIAVIIITNAAL